MPTATIAYSYTRFSSPAQEDGDSVRRQTALRDAWLARQPGVKLDRSLTLIDRGKSAYRGAHRTDRRHALAQFLDLVERGRVPKGSYLIVENLDRLTRETPVVSIPAVLNLIGAGIRVVQLTPSEIVYDDAMEQHHLMNMLWELARGHGESARKSSLCGEAWQEKKRQARENRTPFGASCPAWIDVVGVKRVLSGGKYRNDFSEAKYVLKPGAAAAVREVFRLAARGLGTAQITRELTASKVPAIGKKGTWVRSYVQKLLMDRAVLGEYQPTFGRRRKERDGEAIEGYYPPAVTPELWAAARGAMAGRLTRDPRRRPPRVAHPFNGLLTCALDGCGMYTITLKYRRYVVSQTAYDAGKGHPNRRPFPLDVLRSALLRRMEELRAQDLFADPSAGRIAKLLAKESEIKRKLAIARAKFDADHENGTWASMVDEYDRAKRLASKELAEAQAEAASPLPAAWAEAVELMAEDDPERLRAVLQRVIEDIRVLVVKHGQTRFCAVQVFFVGGAVRGYLIRWTRSVALPRCRKPDIVGARSFAEVRLPAGRDLRNPADAAALEELIRKGMEKLLRKCRPGTPAAE